MKTPNSANKAPFNIERFGNRVGKGKDNMVLAMPIPGREKELVVKINHDNRGTRTPEQVEAAVRYKKEKYEILKLFLGDFVPDSSFLVGTKDDGKGPRPVEYVVQQRLPNHYIKSLTPEQREDPRLISNMLLLMIKMENMHKTIGNVNARNGNAAALLDAKLDLGGISGYIEDHIDEEFTPRTAMEAINRKGDTPNILVDPDTMDIYCIDFDEGVWTDEKSEAKAMLFNLVETREDVQEVIRLQVSDLMHPSAHPNGSHVAA